MRRVWHHAAMPYADPNSGSSHGRDIYWWFGALDVWNRSLEQYPDLKRGAVFTVSGADGGRDIDLRRFPAEGITLDPMFAG